MSDNTSDQIEDLSIKYRKDYHTAKYIFNKCKKETLTDLCNVINNGLKTKECGFDDSLLFLSKMVNSEKFTSNLKETTKECLCDQYKTVKTYNFFKNNLLNSNVWASKNDGSVSTVVESKEKDKEKEKQATTLTTLFDQIKHNVILDELKAQQQYIQNCIISQEKNNSKFWKQLTTQTFDTVLTETGKGDTGYGRYSNKNKIVYSELSCLHNIEVKPDFSIEELPFDNVNGFDGAKEYDHHGYLTKLLVYCYQVRRITTFCFFVYCFIFSNFGPLTFCVI